MKKNLLLHKIIFLTIVATVFQARFISDAVAVFETLVTYAHAMCYDREYAFEKNRAMA